MALKPKQENLESRGTPGDRLPPPMTVLFKQDLEEHKRSPSVQVRLQRVNEMLEVDLQHKQTG